MPKIKYIIFICLILFGTLFYILNRHRVDTINNIIPLKIKEKNFQVEVVSDRQKMEIGLGKRKGICENCGMLFEFSKSGKYAFWMKDMQFPLDILWIANRKIVYIEKNVQPDFIGTLISNDNADIVLEINAGKSDDLGIKIGDLVGF